MIQKLRHWVTELQKHQMKPYVVVSKGKGDESGRKPAHHLCFRDQSSCSFLRWTNGVSLGSDVPKWEVTKWSCPSWCKQPAPSFGLEGGKRGNPEASSTSQHSSTTLRSLQGSLIFHTSLCLCFSRVRYCSRWIFPKKTVQGKRQLETWVSK